MPDAGKALGKGMPSAVDKALENLRSTMVQALIEEQRRDQLTGLANDHALAAWIQDRIDGGERFWIAFIEVDRFKNINDKFGYDNADLLLIRIAEQLRRSSADHFTTPTTPFRAHGDEFFLAGMLPAENSETLIAEVKAVSDRLELILKNVASVRISVRDKAEPILGTVSIGWLVSDDLQSADLTGRSVRHSLELTTSRAKLTRNASVRFQPEFRHIETTDGRSDCGVCESKYSVTVKVDQVREEDLYCPNCGERGHRPHSLRPNQIVVAGH